MRSLSNDLVGFARAIAAGHDLPQQQVSCPRYPVATALDIYRNNYRGNLQDTLSAAYPVIEQLVGQDFFRWMAREYIAQHPSNSGNLHLYGAQMASFIAAFVPAQGLAYLPDMAALEWACHRAYYAPDAATLDISALAQVSPQQYSGLILTLHPACHLLHSRYPVAAIWHAHQPHTQISATASDFHINLDSGACNVLVSRGADSVCVDELPQADYDWLLRLQAGSTLGAATSATLQRFADFDLRPALLNVASHGVLAGFGQG